MSLLFAIGFLGATGCVAPAKGDWESKYTTQGGRDTFTLDEDQEGTGVWRSLGETPCDVDVRLEETDDGWTLHADGKGEASCASQSISLQCELSDFDELECDGDKTFRNIEEAD